MIITQSIAEQLTDIYFKYEWWSQPKMSYQEALNYHQERLDNGSIQVILDNGEVVAYYQREFNDEICFLVNVWVRADLRGSKVWRDLYRHFFNTMPINIKKVIGEKQKIHGRMTERFITKERRNGKP